MTRPWRNDEQQAQYEAQLADRFEDARGWVDLAKRAMELDQSTEVRARDFGIFVPLARAGADALVRVPALWSLRDDYEQLRLGAKYASLAGITEAQESLNQWYREIRAQRSPVDVQRYQHAIAIVQQYLLDPDRRATFSKVLSSFGLAPGQRIK